eukprot:976586_1
MLKLTVRPKFILSLSVLYLIGNIEPKTTVYALEARFECNEKFVLLRINWWSLRELSHEWYCNEYLRAHKSYRLRKRYTLFRNVDYEQQLSIVLLWNNIAVCIVQTSIAALCTIACLALVYMWIMVVMLTNRLKEDYTWITTKKSLRLSELICIHLLILGNCVFSFDYPSDWFYYWKRTGDPNEPSKKFGIFRENSTENFKSIKSVKSIKSIKFES